MTSVADRKSVWRHFKGDYYRVTAEATNASEGQELQYVVYSPCNETGSLTTTVTYVRPLSDFVAMVLVSTNVKKQRFVYIMP